MTRLLDMKLSIATIIGWGVALLGLTFTGSMAYGEQKQKLLFLSERQTRIEVMIEQVQASQREIGLSLARIETRLKEKEK